MKTDSNTISNPGPSCSIAVRAWNEESAIRATLESLFQQSIFEELSARGEHCEVICVPNGCTDRTAEVAQRVFDEQRRTHPFAKHFSCRVENVAQAGRNNTWNLYVHSFSHPDARALYLMDSDIVFDRPETLFNMYAAMLNDPAVQAVGDRQIKHIENKNRKSLIDRISLATSDMTATIQGRISGQLYCIRASAARRLYLPKDLGAPDDGFIKAALCSEFFTEPLNPARIVIAQNASHIYEAYTSIADVLNNQKRQMIGQTTVYVLVEYLKTLPEEKKRNLSETIHDLDTANPDWLKQLIDEHLKRTRHFWRLFPGVLTFRLKRWWQLNGVNRLSHAPAALVGTLVTLIACARAHRHFRKGLMHFWPKANRMEPELMQRKERASSAYPSSPGTGGIEAPTANIANT